MAHKWTKPPVQSESLDRQESLARNIFVSMANLHGGVYELSHLAEQSIEAAEAFYQAWDSRNQDTINGAS